MELRLFHGRKDPDQDMETTGFWYPVIPGVIRVKVVYLNTWLVTFENNNIKELVAKATGWESWGDSILCIPLLEDMLVALNEEGETCYFGDWEIADDGVFENHPSGYLVSAPRKVYVGKPYVKKGYAVCEVFNSDGTPIHTERVHPGFADECLEDAKGEVISRCNTWLAGYNALRSRLEHNLES